MGNKYILIGKEKLYLFENHKTSNSTPAKDKERKKNNLFYTYKISHHPLFFFLNVSVNLMKQPIAFHLTVTSECHR